MSEKFYVNLLIDGIPRKLFEITHYSNQTVIKPQFKQSKGLHSTYHSENRNFQNPISHLRQNIKNKWKRSKTIFSGIKKLNESISLIQSYSFSKINNDLKSLKIFQSKCKDKYDIEISRILNWNHFMFYRGTFEDLMKEPQFIVSGYSLEDNCKTELIYFEGDINPGIGFIFLSTNAKEGKLIGKKNQVMGSTFINKDGEIQPIQAFIHIPEDRVFENKPNDNK